MAKTILEPARRIPVAGEYDVVVAGGGIAGVAAALAAARSGASVCLLEKESALGGLATLGNVVIYLPLCDGRGRKVIGGLGEELLKLSIKDRPDALPPCWRRDGDREERREKRYRVEFNPHSFLLAMENLVLRNKVKLLYDTRVCEVSMHGNRIDSVIVENKSGRSALRCRTVVDTTGDADVCARAGEETVSLDTNALSGWFYWSDGESVNIHKLWKPYTPSGCKLPRGARGYAGDDAEDVTQHLIVSRRFTRQRLKEIQADHPGKAVFPLLLPTIASFRMTRRLRGEVELETSHEREWFDDTVGMTGDWRRAGPIYCIPLRSLVAVKTPNLITAGRCISATGDVWDITRAIPTCALTGEAAGIAAAMAAQGTRGNIRRVDVSALQAALKRRRGILNPKLLT